MYKRLKLIFYSTCLSLIVALPAYGLNDNKASVTGKSVPGVIGTTPISYGYDYYAEDPSPTGQTRLTSSIPAILAATNQMSFGKYYFPTPSANGWAQSFWGFTATNDPKITGNIVLGDLLGPVPYKYGVHAIVQTPKPDYGLALAWNKSWIDIGRTEVARAGTTNAFAETYFPWSNLAARLLAKTRAAIHDDSVGYADAWTMGADGFSPFSVFTVDLRLSADGPGSFAEISEMGITLGNTDSMIETKMYVKNQFDFDGYASLTEGVFTMSGDYSGLPWQLTYDPNNPIYVTSAFLSSAYLPSGPITLLETDIGDSTFWNSKPWFEAAMVRTQAAEAVFVPEPSTLLLLGSGLSGIIVFGRKRLFRKS